MRSTLPLTGPRPATTDGLPRCPSRTAAPDASLDHAGSSSPRGRGGKQPASSPRRLWSIALVAWSVLVPPTGIVPAQPAETTGPQRWEKAIRAFEQQDRRTPPPQDPILFVGSSSIRLWDVQKFFPGLPVLNRGFGGSEISDAIHFADRIVIKYRPRCIVMYAGDNDIARGKTPQRVADDFRRFVRNVHAELPGTPIVYIAIKPSIARWKLWPQMRQANRLIAEFCRRHPHLTFVDIATPMLRHGQPPPRELFVKDGLHLSEKGYRLWADLVRPHLPSDDTTRRDGR
ncbi:MAG: hypothetical protein D6725_09595 [Planctomycetota bacterium]|nr:MAG: hypothetical protein D6725_09595 [Planctomycetota bacterium]